MTCTPRGQTEADYCAYARRTQANDVLFSRGWSQAWESRSKLGRGIRISPPQTPLTATSSPHYVDQPWYRLDEYIRKVLGEWRKVNRSDLLHLAEGLVSVCLEQPT